MVTNLEVAERFREIADLLDLLGERFKPEAYRRAARSIESLSEPITAVSDRGDLRTIPGIGEAIEEKIREYLTTGTIPYLDRLHAEVPSGVVELMRLPGVGPKTARRFWTELGVDGPATLTSAVEGGRLNGVRGFGEKKIAQLRATLAAAHGGPGDRLPLERAWPIAERLTAQIAKVPGVHDLTVAGSFRRGRESVGDLDLLVTSDAPEAIFDAFSSLPEVKEVRMRGGTKETVILRTGLQADLRVVEPAAFGAALQYFTGSKDHNVKLRSLARDRGLKVNEYGVFRGEERLASRTEEEVYRALGLAWIPPELREDRGEIEAAAHGPFPRLIEAGDLAGELHQHLEGRASGPAVREIARRARARHLSYVGFVVPEDAPTSLLTAIRAESGPGFRTLVVAEVDPGSMARVADRTGVDYLIVRPSDGPPTAPIAGSGATRIGLVAHVGGDLARVDPWIAAAAGAAAAVEVGPGPERLDSSAARLARTRGVRLGIPLGLTSPEEEAVGPAALEFARRAGASPADVANAGPAPTAGTRRRKG
jgi:DNA polymerase/3'-5' exonuclease PolX